MKKRLMLTLVLILSFSLLTGCLENEEVLQEEALEEVEEVLTSFSEGVYEGNRSKVKSTLSSEEKIKIMVIEDNEIHGEYHKRDEFLELVMDYFDKWDADNINLSFLAENIVEVEADYSVIELGSQYEGDAVIRLIKEDETWHINILELYN